MTSSDEMKNQNTSTQDAAEGERGGQTGQQEPQASTQEPAEGSRSSAEGDATPSRD
ncbi:middle molecular weight neurofilament protein NF-M(2) [Deinococcus proteolyticus MRP]|uniref:Middle molecular weight neurofilament protein NF-M(2) n=1 Tax=Deinococcus proteolyticus (strain ATCC 35074 / DSM 20540 / JCM 6276 / NBRC 101906 / NCIMB 13154 / VKM Ac-1939 / CCM 2703 / MRP) TaxID=693977 RepID=F0RL63_DEIPM|nr:MULTISPECIES: hypothetical protein [Deinococcus]ADY26855.1 middle molecular weight neurofilament protein NF-M(2) [Deinococcus proteolyticus MRP]MCY1702977.1 hypothetical protein [Deinococcus sp. SL84]